MSFIANFLQLTTISSTSLHLFLLLSNHLTKEKYMTIIVSSIHLCFDPLPTEKITTIQKILAKYQKAYAASLPTFSQQMKQQEISTLSERMYPNVVEIFGLSSQCRTKWNQCERFIITYLNDHKKTKPYFHTGLWQQTALHVARTALLLFFDRDHLLYDKFPVGRSLIQMTKDLQQWLAMEEIPMPFLLYTQTKHLERTYAKIQNFSP